MTTYLGLYMLIGQLYCLYVQTYISVSCPLLARKAEINEDQSSQPGAAHLTHVFSSACASDSTVHLCVVLGRPLCLQV